MKVRRRSACQWFRKLRKPAGLGIKAASPKQASPNSSLASALPVPVSQKPPKSQAEIRISLNITKKKKKWENSHHSTPPWNSQPGRREEDSESFPKSVLWIGVGQNYKQVLKKTEPHFSRTAKIIKTNEKYGAGLGSLAAGVLSQHLVEIISDLHRYT